MHFYSNEECKNFEICSLFKTADKSAISWKIPISRDFQSMRRPLLYLTTKYSKIDQNCWRLGFFSLRTLRKLKNRKNRVGNIWFHKNVVSLVFSRKIRIDTQNGVENGAILIKKSPCTVVGFGFAVDDCYYDDDESIWPEGEHSPVVGGGEGRGWMSLWRKD